MPRTLYPRAFGSKKPLFQLFGPGLANGVDNLDPSLTINSITVTPTYRYKLGDATVSTLPAWTYGSTLSKVEVGTDVTPNWGSPLFGSSNDDSCMFNAADYFQASSASTGDVSTEDVVFEVLFRTDIQGATRNLFGKRNSLTAGYFVAITSTGTIQCGLRNAGGTAANTASAATTQDSWNHAIFFGDRSGSGQWYVNGQASGAAVAISTVDNLTNATEKLTAAALSDGSLPYNGAIAYFAMWAQGSWLDTHLQATVAADRFARLVGVYPQKAKGTAVPSTVTRATEAQLDYINTSTDVRRSFKVGSNWPRICRRKSSGGNYITGYLAELATTNLCLQSEVFGTTWTVIDAGDTISANQIAAVNNTTTADGVIADSTNGDHGVTQDIAVTAANYTFSVWAKAGNKTWIYMSDDTVANATCYFDIGNGVVGTAGAGIGNATMQNWGNGWYRCNITFLGTAATHTFKIQPADADGDKSVVGDGATINTYLWGAQLEQKDLATSYIRTTTASVTRNKDQLTYSATSQALAAAGSLVCKVLAPVSYNNTALLCVASLNDGSADNRVDLNITTGDVPEGIMVSATTTTADVVGTTDATNSNDHTLSVMWTTDDVRLYVNGVSEGTPDTSAAVPAATLTDIDVGQTAASLSAPNLLISNLRIYPKTGVST